MSYKPTTLRGQLKQKLNPKPVKPKEYNGKGTRARLNTAAEKVLFNRDTVSSRSNYEIN